MRTTTRGPRSNAGSDPSPQISAEPQSARSKKRQGPGLRVLRGHGQTQAGPAPPPCVHEIIEVGLTTLIPFMYFSAFLTSSGRLAGSHLISKVPLSLICPRSKLMFDRLPIMLTLLSAVDRLI